MLVVVCFCVCVLCCGASSRLASLPTTPTLERVEYQIGQNGDLCTLIDNDAPNKIQNLKWLQNGNHS